MNPFQVRGRVPQLDQDRNAFIHNSIHYGTSRFRIDPSTPLSELAYQNRLAIIQAVDQKDIEIGLTVSREMVRRKQALHICEPLETSFNVTSWTAAWRELDFSAAIKRQDTVEAEQSALKFLVLGEAKELASPSRCKYSSLDDKLPTC
jgi:hypothetical protein